MLALPRDILIVTCLDRFVFLITISDSNMDHNHHEHHQAPMPKATAMMKMNHAHHQSLVNTSTTMMPMHHDHHTGHESHSMAVSGQKIMKNRFQTISSDDISRWFQRANIV